MATSKLTIESFRYRICGICTVNWVLTKDDGKLSEIIVTCDKCKGKNSWSSKCNLVQQATCATDCSLSTKDNPTQQATTHVTNRPLSTKDNLIQRTICVNDSLLSSNNNLLQQAALHVNVNSLFCEGSPMQCVNDNSLFNANNNLDISTSRSTDERSCIDHNLSVDFDVKCTNTSISENLPPADCNEWDEFHINELPIGILDYKLKSTTDIIAPLLKTASVKSKAGTYNEVESMSVETYSDDITSSELVMNKTNLTVISDLPMENSGIAAQEHTRPLKQDRLVAVSPVVKRPKISAFGSLTHACPICFQLFTSRIEMKKHEQLHMPDHTDRCGICRMTFESKSMLLQHYRTEHHMCSNSLTGASFICSVCRYRTKLVSVFDRHVRLHSGEKPFVCTQCRKRYIDKKMLVKHIISAHQSEWYNNALSAQRIARAYNAETSQFASVPRRTVQIAGASKPIINTIFNLQTVSHQTASALQAVPHQTAFPYREVSHQMASTLQAVAQQGTANILQADATQATSALLKVEEEQISSVTRGVNQHLRLYVNDLSTLDCLVCGQQFRRRKEMKKHERLHKPDPNEHCGICRKTFKTRALLLEHYRSKHRDSLSHSFHCPFCSYVVKYKEIRTFIVHLFRHTGEKPYVCTICELRYSDRTQLVHHIKCRHENNSSKIYKINKALCRDFVDKKLKTFVQDSSTHACLYCLQQFSGRTELVEHERLHVPDQNETCIICGQTFDTEILLKLHYVCEHRDSFSKLLTCSVCPYTSKVVKDFVSHARLHTGATPYACTLCGKRFINKRTLVDHAKIACRAIDVRSNNSNATRQIALDKRLSDRDSCVLGTYNASVLFVDAKQPYLILTRVDDSYPCRHQCRVCPKIFHSVAAVARHELTHV